MRRNTPATTPVPSPLIVNRTAYRAAVQCSVARCELTATDWHEAIERLVCRAATYSWHVMHPVIEPQRDDPEWAATHLGEGKLVWRLGMDRSCVDWPVRWMSRVVNDLIALADSKSSELRSLAVRALASARRGDVLAVVQVEKDLPRERKTPAVPDIEAIRDAMLCPPARVVVGSAVKHASGQLEWRRCTTVEEIEQLGAALDDTCLRNIHRGADWPPSPAYRTQVFTGERELWGLFDGGTPVAVAEISEHDRTRRLRPVKFSSPKDDSPHIYRPAIGALWSWHCAYEPGPHEPDWALAEMHPPLMRWGGRLPGAGSTVTFTGMQPRLPRDEQFLEDPLELSPAWLPATPTVRRALLSDIDPDRNWTTNPPRLAPPGLIP